MSVVRAALAVLLCTALGGLMVTPAHAAPYSSHSQIYACCTDPVTMDTMFREAKASGAAFIRVEIEINGIAPDSDDLSLRDWLGSDLVAQLSQRYQLPVDGVLVGVAHDDTMCPDQPLEIQPRCPPRDPARWAAVAGEIAARYAGTIDHFEILNEPDGAWAFRGSPEDYAWMLAYAYDAIKARAPGASVIAGGTMYSGVRGNAWLDRVFNTPWANASAKFDIGDIHLRGALPGMLGDLRARQAFWVKWGRHVPTWVTEHGYPSDPAYQAGAPAPLGEPAQAAYLAQTLPALALAGAAQIFVTLRDGGDGQYGSEGILAGQGRPGEAFRRKLAFQTVVDATRQWPMVLALASRPAALAFKPGFLVASARAGRASRARASASGSSRGGALRRAGPKAWSRLPLDRVRVEVRGRFAGPGCTGQVELTYRVPRARRTVRTASVDARCRYRVDLGLRLPTTLKLPARLRIDQRYLGSPTTTAGMSKSLSVKLMAPKPKPKPKSKAKSKAKAPRRRAHH